MSLFSLVASGQIKLRRIDGWQDISRVLSRHARRRRSAPAKEPDATRKAQHHLEAGKLRKKIHAGATR